MAKQSIIEMRKAQAMEEINMRLARIEAALGISDKPAPAPEEPAAPQEAETPAEPEAAEAPKASRRKS